MASMFRQNFSSGMNYLRRRFSSDDLYHERDDLDSSAAGIVGASSADVGYGRIPSSASSSSAAAAGGGVGFAPKMPSAPSFPSLSSVQDMTRGILSQAAAAASSAVNAAAQGTIGSGTVTHGAGGGTPQRIVYSNERCKILLIVDDKHTDWLDAQNGEFGCLFVTWLYCFCCCLFATLLSPVRHLPMPDRSEWFHERVADYSRLKVRPLHSISLRHVISFDSTYRSRLTEVDVSGNSYSARQIVFFGRLVDLCERLEDSTRRIALHSSYKDDCNS